MRKRSLPERFWEKVTKHSNGCWEWQAYLTPKGYGVVRADNGQTQLAHRVAWQMTRGPIPSDLCCLHRCDNPKCVNPEHLFLGTKTDNNLDRVAKGRSRGLPQAGELNHSAKLSWAMVSEIRRLHRMKHMSQGAIATRFGITQSTVSRIVRYQGWIQH